MFSILRFIKYNLNSIWSIIEWVNGKLFCLTYQKALLGKLNAQLQLQTNEELQFRFLSASDIHPLKWLLDSLEDSQKGFFEVHAYDLKALQNKFQNPSFLMMGVFDNQNKMIGYFLLRCFINKKCFVGRLLHKDFRNKGIGTIMTQILHQAAWQSGFRVFATLSPNNTLVIQSHKKNDNMKFLKELPNNYWLVEFVKPTSSY